jgi:23S rRNA (uracil1939-C5)-methyltransferase
MVEPLCKYFGICNGCQSQHIPYQLQIENKKKLLQRATNFNVDEINVFSDNQYNYRNRLDLLFTKNGLGMRTKEDSKSCVHIDECKIAAEKINFLIKELNKNFNDVDFFDLRKKEGTYRHAVVRISDEESSISFVLNSHSTKLNLAVEKIKEYAKISSAQNIIITYVLKDVDESISRDYFLIKGSAALHQKYLGKEFEYSIQGFFQNNTLMAEKMHEYVHEICSKYADKNLSLLDLYSGVGTFGINNFEFFKNLFIVENDKSCVESAKENISKNKISNAKIIELDAMQIKRLDLPDENLIVITDPPRSGMHLKTIEELNKLKPKVIIYISCNVMQLGKELMKFKKYQIKSVAMFDLFPHTNHMESIVELVLKE